MHSQITATCTKGGGRYRKIINIGKWQNWQNWWNWWNSVKRSENAEPKRPDGGDESSKATKAVRNHRCAFGALEQPRFFDEPWSHCEWVMMKDMKVIKVMKVMSLEARRNTTWLKMAWYGLMLYANGERQTQVMNRRATASIKWSPKKKRMKEVKEGIQKLRPRHSPAHPSRQHGINSIC